MFNISFRSACWRTSCLHQGDFCSSPNCPSAPRAVFRLHALHATLVHGASTSRWQHNSGRQASVVAASSSEGQVGASCCETRRRTAALTCSPTWATACRITYASRDQPEARRQLCGTLLWPHRNARKVQHGSAHMPPLAPHPLQHQLLPACPEAARMSTAGRPVHLHHRNPAAKCPSRAPPLPQQPLSAQQPYLRQPNAQSPPHLPSSVRSKRRPYQPVA